MTQLQKIAAAQSHMAPSKKCNLYQLESRKQCQYCVFWCTTVHNLHGKIITYISAQVVGGTEQVGMTGFTYVIVCFFKIFQGQGK